jgi:signal transduction histidine kinase
VGEAGGPRYNVVWELVRRAATLIRWFFLRKDSQRPASSSLGVFPLTPEAVINKYLDASQSLGAGTAEVRQFAQLLATDADLLGRWLTLLDCPADPAALIAALSELDPSARAQFAEAQAWAGLPVSGSARLSMEQWQSALRGACLGELLARALGLDDSETVHWQVLLGSSGFNLPHDPVVEELIEFRGIAPELLEDAAPLLKIFAVVDALERQDAGVAGELAQRLLGIGAQDFADLVGEAQAQVVRRMTDIGLADFADDDWAERLWARQQVSLLGRLFAQSQTAAEMYTAHRFASRNLFGFVPYLLVFDPERKALVPADDSGVGIHLDSHTSAIAGCVRHGQAQELSNEPHQAVVDRQVLRRLSALDGLCVPMFAGEAPLGALVFRVDEDVDHEFLMQAYGDELARWLASVAEPAEGRQSQLARYRDQEQKRLREIVHEANNPLSIVHNYLHILELRLQHEPAAAEQLEMISTELRRAGEIFQRARDVTPLAAEPADTDVVISEFDVNEIARRALELHQGYAADHSVRLDSELAAEAVWVASDHQRLAQILNNLLRNAIEASSGASVAVASSAGVFRGGQEGIELTVRDTGPGLPRSVLETLAEPKQSTKGGDHAGLGLHIVHRLVAEMGGSIDVRTGGGQGTTFRIYLPLTPR